MKRGTETSAALVVGTRFATTLLLMRRGRASSEAESRSRFEIPDSGRADLVAGPGRVEPLLDSIEAGSEISGKLRSVLVDTWALAG
jgi:hypothetical protein